MNTTNLARVAVQRGAAFLDEERPGWRAEISVPAIDISSTQWCVRGQIYGDWMFAPEMPFEQARELGFEFTDDDDGWADGISYDELTAAWKELLSA